MTTESTLRHEITVVIKDKTGFHTRTAAIFAKQAGAFDCTVRVRHQNKKNADGKSMLGLMSLGVKTNAHITIVAEGSDAKEAVAALRELVEKDFGAEL